MKLDQGDVFIVHDVGEVTSFGLVVFTGPFDYQRLTQSVFTKEQAVHWENIAYVITDTVKIPLNQLRTVVIEPLDEAGDPEMIEALSKAKEKEHPNVKFLTRLKKHEELGQIHKLFKSDQEVNRNLAASMLIGSLNETFADLVPQG